MPPTYHIGTSGWVYRHWKGRFYPETLPQTRWLPYYLGHFDTVELNNSFYRLPTEQAFQRWGELAPPGFLYAVKASRFVTHIKRLRDPEVSVEKFLDRAKLLKEHLGPILYQLPANFHRDDERLGSFLRVLPSRFRSVLEFRHDSWFADPVLDLLRGYQVGFCAFDRTGLPCPVVATTPFIYIRFHGSSRDGGNYPDDELRDWAARIRSLAANINNSSSDQGESRSSSDQRESRSSSDQRESRTSLESPVDVYIYFNNDWDGHAIRNAITLRDLLTA
jgi:uncharacterized protein YecE (DUF72 family)